MHDYTEVERKAEEEKFSVESQPHFCFSIRPARILSDEEKNSMRAAASPNEVKLFDVGEKDIIKESFLHNDEKSDPIESTKFYVNVVYADKVLPPLDKNKDFANPKDDGTWMIIPIVFSEAKKRKNLSNVECFHYDAHVNTCVFEKCKESPDRLKAIFNNIVQRFQHHIRFDYLLHKKSLKICKSKKYKHSTGNGS